MDIQMKRLYQAAKELKDINGQSQLARALGTSPQTVKNWESRGISKQGLIDAQNILGISATWLQTGNGNSRFQAHTTGQDEFTALPSLEFPLASNTPPHQYIFKRVLEQKELTDKSITSEPQDGKGFYLPFNPAMLKVKGIEQHNIICAILSGDTMLPLMPEGTVFAADKGCTDIRDGQIYAFLHDDLFRIKRLERQPGNQVRMMSENTKYADKTVSLNEIELIGRVFWWSVLA